jgi:hypothetical protein
MRTSAWMLGGLIALPLMAIAFWYATYPDPRDPKHPNYILWKVGLNPFENLDDATSAVLSDVHRREIVVGRTEEQLRETFGYLVAPDAAKTRLAECAAGVPWLHGRKARYVRASQMLVVFDGDIVTDVVNMKPC